MSQALAPAEEMAARPAFFDRISARLRYGPAAVLLIAAGGASILGNRRKRRAAEDTTTQG